MRESADFRQDKETMSPMFLYFTCGGLCLVIFLADLAIPRGIAFGVLYVVPVLWSIWDPKTRLTYVLWVTSSMLIVLDYFFSVLGPSISESYINVALSLLAVWSTSALVINWKIVHEGREKQIAAVKESILSEVEILRGLLPICASCKKIRDDKAYWRQVEQYVSEHSEAEFSHSICPDCVRKLYPEYADDVLGRRQKDEKQ